MNTKVIIGAAGSSLRWENYLGVPKQLAPVYGEPLIHRTIRQLAAVGFDNIAVMSNDERMVIPPAHLEKPIWDVNGHPLAGCCIAHTQPHWDALYNALILMGDVCWNRIDIAGLYIAQQREIMFAVHFASREKHNPEIFGVYIPAHLKCKVEAACEYVSVHRPTKEGERQSDGWMIYRKLHGRNIKVHANYGGLIECSPDTEDFDHPEEYDNWIKNHP